LATPSFSATPQSQTHRPRSKGPGPASLVERYGKRKRSIYSGVPFGKAGGLFGDSQNTNCVDQGSAAPKSFCLYQISRGRIRASQRGKTFSSMGVKSPALLSRQVRRQDQNYRYPTGERR
jgi:hypothetical protein